MNMKRCIMASAIAASLSVAASGGDTWRYTGNSYKSEAFSQAQFWTDGDGTGNVGTTGAALEPDDYYIVDGWKVFWTPASQAANTTFTFGGKRLTLGEIGKGKTAGYMELRNYTDTTVAYFPDDGVVLANGWMKARGYKTREHPIDGKLTVTAPASAPFMLGARNSYSDQTLTLKGELIGDSTAALKVSNFIQNDLVTNVIVKLSGNCSQYYGAISVTSTIERTAAMFGAALSLASISMPGSVIVQNDGILRTVSKTDIATVGSLSFEPGSCIALQAGTVSSKLTNGYFRVTGSFSATGPVTVTIPSSVVPLDATSMRFPIVEMPLASTVSTNDFIVEFSDAAAAWPLEWLHFEVDEGETTKRLVLVSEPVVRQTSADYDSYSPGHDSSLTNASHWLDSDVPHPGCNYIVHGNYSKVLRTLSNTSLDYQFAGDSLTLYRYSSNKGANLFLFSHSFSVPFFCNLSGGVAGGSYVPVAILRADRMRFTGSCSITVQIGGYVELDGPISGSGVISMSGNSANGSNGRVWLNGDNSSYKGKIKLSVGNATPNDTDVFQTLYVADGNNLGGAMDEFAYDALTLEAYALLCTTNGSVTLAGGLNRGLYVNDVGRIRAEAGHTLSVGWPLTLNGTLRKEGEGTLLLGGEAMFTPVDGVPSDTPTANANIVQMKAGGIGVTSARALDGMELKFEPGSRLTVKADADDADLLARGLVNSKAATPFAVDGGLDRIPVEIVSNEPPPSGRFTVAVATVPAASAGAVQSLMGHVRVPAAWGSSRAIWNEPAVDGETGLATLSVTVRKVGTMFSIR